MLKLFHYARSSGIEKLQDILDETYVYVLTYSLYLLKFIQLYSMIFIYCLNCSNPCALKTICISSIAPGVGCSIGQHAGPSIECWEPQSYGIRRNVCCCCVLFIDFQSSVSLKEWGMNYIHKNYKYIQPRNYISLTGWLNHAFIRATMWCHWCRWPWLPRSSPWSSCRSWRCSLKFLGWMSWVSQTYRWWNCIDNLVLWVAKFLHISLVGKMLVGKTC